MWSLSIILYTVTSAAIVVLQRMQLRDGKNDPVAYAFWFQALSALLLFVVAMIHGWHMPSAKQLFPIIAAMSTSFGVGQVLFTIAMKRVHASLGSLFWSTSAIWLTIASILFLDEQLTLRKLFGICLIFLGVMIAVVRPRVLSIDRYVILGLLAGTLFGLGGFFWVYVGRNADPYTWSTIRYAGPAAVAILLSPRVLVSLSDLRSKRQSWKWMMACVVGLQAVCIISGNFAYKFGSAAVTSALAQLFLIVTVGMGFAFLGEREDVKKKCVAALLCGAGAIFATIT